MSFFVYLLECRDGTYYCGYTSDLTKRLANHNKGIGSKYTKRRRPVRMIYSEEQPSLSAALKREHSIKKLTRKEKEELVQKK